MAIMIFLLANLKKRKSYSIVISILVFLAGLILTVTVSTALNVFSAYDDAFNAIKSPHLIYWLPETDYKPELKAWFDMQPGVEVVTAMQVRSVTGAELRHDGNVLRSNVSLYLQAYNPAASMHLFDTKYDSSSELPEGEIYLPYIFKTGNGLATGDKVEYVFGSISKVFTVAGFAEEPLFGAELHGIKLLFLSRADVAELEKAGVTNIIKTMQIRVRMANYTEAAAQEMIRRFNQELNENTGIVYTYSTFASGHITLPRISLAVMIAFVLILFVITVTIMRYAILATIEADYTNIGILKALGFTPGMVQTAITGQYALLALLAGLLGLLASALFTPVVGSLILNSSGLASFAQLTPAVGLAALFALVLIISLFSAMTARRARRVSPVQAIAQGIAPVYFSSRVNFRLERMGFLPFSLRMATKQILTKSKRYVLLVAVSAMLSYTLVFLLGLVQLFNSDRSLNMLGGALSDIRVSAPDRQAVASILDDIRSDYLVKWTAFQKTAQMVIDGNKTTVRIMDDFDAGGELTTTTGRHPKHDNEVAVSELLADRLGKHVGDTLKVKDADGAEYPFLITGLFQTIDDGGTYVRMPEAGMMKINPDFNLNTAYVKLQSHDKLDSMIAEMRARYTGYDEIANERKFTNNKLGTIQGVFSQISILVFFLTVMIIGFVTLLVVKITVVSELRELGIYKALGFCASKLRWQLALRFLLVTLMGGIAGVVVESFLGAKMFSLLMKGFGLSSILIDFNLVNILVPLAAIALISMLSAYLSSRSVRTVTAYSLIME